MIRRLVLTPAIVLLTVGSLTAARPDGELEVRVVDAETQAPLAARMHLTDARGRAVRTSGLGVAAHGDHFYLDGSTVLGLRRGLYNFLVDAGWDRRTQFSQRPFEIERRSEDTKTLEFRRFANLSEEGCFAADLDADRSLENLDVAIRAEGLAYLPLVEWRFERGEWRETKRNVGERTTPPGVGLHAARIDSPDGALLFYRIDQEIDPSDLPSGEDLTVAALRTARAKGYHIVVADLTAWRLPVWLAAGVIDAVCVIDRTSGFDSVDAKSSTGRPAPRRLYPGDRGPGRWRQAIYFHVLNAGLRLPAVAGSGSGDTDSPIGTNRVYAHCDQECSAESWWRAALDGKTVVTNGPLLRPTVFGEPPGFVFPLSAGESFTASIGLNLSTRETIDYLELIQSGEPVATVRLADWAEAGGRLPELEFTEPGWFAVRAVTGQEGHYQLALTSAYYVGDEPRVSRASCEFFLEWLKEAEARDKAGRGEETEAASSFWQKRFEISSEP